MNLKGLLHFKIFTQELGKIFAIYHGILCKICILQQPLFVGDLVVMSAAGNNENNSVLFIVNNPICFINSSAPQAI